MTGPVQTPKRRQQRFIVLASLAGAFALGSAGSIAVPASATAQPAGGTSHVVNAFGGRVTLSKVAVVDLRTLARRDARRHRPTAAAASPGMQAPIDRPPAAGRAGPTRLAAAARLARITRTQVPGEHGFDGLTAAINAAANSPRIGAAGDVTPPDQGLAVGPSAFGTVIVEFVNESLDIYSPNGDSLLGAIPSYQVFHTPADFFLADPRAYWDPRSGHWFLTQFTLGFLANGTLTGQAEQYIAVSQTTSPFGPYTVFSFSTNDASTSGCPCYGDFDQVGMNANGLFIATNEIGQISGSFNGSVLYATSKRALIAAAAGKSRPAVVQRYRVPFLADPFTSYHLSPSMYTQGSYAPNTEYFVESDSNLAFGSGLEVYALLNTARLRSGGRPTLVVTTVGSEDYSFPPPAIQERGPFPLGLSLGQTSVGQLTTDFNAVQEVTFADGDLYAELDTGFNFSATVRIAWFILHPANGRGRVSVSMVNQGYVQTSQGLLYPVIGVNARGHGYLSFAMASASRWPSAAYMVFDGNRGPTGAIHVAASGAAPLDDFSCYPPFTNGQCRYGDYSMSQNYDGTIYMASEYTAPQPRDPESNWGTRVWFAPVR